MKFIRIIQSAGKDKEIVNKSTVSLPKTSPKLDLDKNDNKGIKPAKNSVKTRNKQVNRRFKIQPDNIYPLQDISTQAFKDLQEQGYNMATFIAWNGACNFCKGINGKTWTLDNFIRSTRYDAPIFSHSHVNAQSEIKVWDKTGELPDVFVNYEGDIHQ